MLGALHVGAISATNAGTVAAECPVFTQLDGATPQVANLLHDASSCVAVEPG
jgi:hypothetical protein